jgi:Zinc-binding dehydrogenase
MTSTSCRSARSRRRASRFTASSCTPARRSAPPTARWQHHILTQVARLADAGILTTTAIRELGPINAANLREAHRIQGSGTAIGKTILTGFRD